MRPQKIVLYPFIKNYTGKKSADEFKEWCKKHYNGFRHTSNAVTTGDILIFSYKEGPGKWIMVGEATVEDAHSVKSKIGSCFVCDERSEYDNDFKVHVLTSDFHAYKNNIDAKRIGIKLGYFAILTSREYGLVQQAAKA